MNFRTRTAAAIAGLVFGSGVALAADSPADKKAKEKGIILQKTESNAAAKKPTDKGAQGGIILQDNAKSAGKKPADKGAQGGIILQDNAKASANKPKDKAAEKGIILQKPADSKPKAPAANPT